MRFIFTLFGIIIILLGLYPVLVTKNLIPPSLAVLPSSGPVYQTIIVVVGLLAVIIGMKSKRKPSLTLGK